MEIFGGEFNAADSVGERNEAEKTSGGDEGNANAAAAFVEVIGVEIFEMNDPRFFGAIEIDGIGGDVCFRDAAEVGAFGLENSVGDVFGEGRGSTEGELLFLFVEQKNGDGENVERFGSEASDFAAEAFTSDEGCGAFGEEGPERTVVVQGAEEMAADGTLEALAKAVGHEEDRQTDKSDEDEQGLEREVFAAAKNKSEFGEEAHADEVGAGEGGG